ncbi:uncharacterized protein LOC114757562 [Neltuma alba]|uniref:uncharacterized protein LOC114757562 n=1 Tax=Neltuma alba TaxID=207710 RepID=UPI0010A3EDA2|nr:uncharacterized protein LOC114757562 [Prosopis alba]
MASSSESFNSSSVTDQNSPYYIHPSENPALVLVAPPLDGANYHGWARSMKMALLSKNKLKFIDGSISLPSVKDPLYPAWERCNNLVQGWIIKSLSPTIARSILWFDQASEIWNDLKSCYSQSDLFRVADLQEEVYTLKQGNMTVSEYYTRLKILWDELFNIRPLKVCDYGSTESALKHHEEDQVIWFLKGLNEQFSSVKSQIMLIDPLPSLNRVFSLVLQQERELQIVPDSKILMAKAPRPTSSASKQVTNKQCTYCGKPRHTKDTCYHKHGFPPGFKFRSSGSPTMVNQLSAHDSASAQAIPTAKPLPPNSSTAAILPQLSPAQYQRLLALLNPPQSSTSSINHFSASASSPVSDIPSSIHPPITPTVTHPTNPSAPIVTSTPTPEPPIVSTPSPPTCSVPLHTNPDSFQTLRRSTKSHKPPSYL